MYSYILSANNRKALAVKSELTYFELRDKIRAQSKRLHEDSTDTVWHWGVMGFVNPQVMTLGDFANSCPAII